MRGTDRDRPESRRPVGRLDVNAVIANRQRRDRYAWMLARCVSRTRMANAETRAQRAARPAREYGAEDHAGNGRYAAVVLLRGRTKLVRDGELDHLLACDCN